MKSAHKSIRAFVIAVIAVIILGMLSSCGKVPAKSAKTLPPAHITSETSSTALNTSSPRRTEPYADYSDVLDSFRKYVSTVKDENDLDSFNNSLNIQNDGQRLSSWSGILNGLRQLRIDTDLPYPEYNKLPLGDVLRQTLGYATKDINGDGVPEMVILSKKYRVIGVFTSLDNRPYLLDGYWDRYRCAIDASGLLYTLSSGGAYYSDFKVQRIEKGSGKLLSVAAFGVDGIEGETEKPRLYKMIDGHKIIINESEFEALRKKYPALTGTFDDAAAQAVTKNSGLTFVPLFK